MEVIKGFCRDVRLWVVLALLAPGLALAQTAPAGGGGGTAAWNTALSEVQTAAVLMAGGLVAVAAAVVVFMVAIKFVKRLRGAA